MPAMTFPPAISSGWPHISGLTAPTLNKRSLMATAYLPTSTAWAWIARAADPRESSL